MIPAADYERVRDELAEKMRRWWTRTASSIGTVVYKPEEIYERIENIPPDLIVHLRRPATGARRATVGTRRVHTFENDTGPDDANHALEGTFITSMKLRESVAMKDPYSIYDIAPTVLDYFGIEVPPDMIGESLLTAGQWLAKQPRELAKGLRTISIEDGKRHYGTPRGWGAGLNGNGRKE